MSDAIEAIRGDAAALYRLVESISALCKNVHTYPVYTGSSRALFAYISTLADQTKEFLEAFPVSAERTSELVYSKRMKLWNLRNHWSSLHEYIKPALDADTLHLPTPLITAVEDRIRTIGGYEKVQFALFQTTEVNYFQVPASNFKDTADGIAGMIKGDRFPPDLGIIGMPYSQSNGLFLNCLLAHEMGHYVFSDQVDKVLVKVDDSLVEIEKLVADRPVEELAYIREMLLVWAEEVFCDIFALSVIGPAYVFALVEVAGATPLEHQPKGVLATFNFFEKDHPAEIARFAILQDVASTLGWWKEFDKLQSSTVKAIKVSLKRLDDIHIEDPYASEAVPEEEILAAFWRVADWLKTSVPAMLPKSADAEEFQRQSKEICNYLREAVVPSSIVMEKTIEYPSAFVILNSSYKFYLTELKSLISKVGREESTSVRSLSKYASTLEAWTLKAIEDSRLIANQEPGDGSSQKGNQKKA